MRQYNPHDLCKRLYDLYGDLLGPEEKELLEKHIRGMFDTCSVSFEQDGDQPDNIASQMNNRNGEVAEADALRIGSYRYVDGNYTAQGLHYSGEYVYMPMSAKTT